MRVLYAGDDKLGTSQFFVGANQFQVFTNRIKDYEPLVEALDGLSGVDAEHMKATDAIEEFPWSIEELDTYDALILSDFSRDTLLPHFREGAIPGPNRLRIIREFVESGGGLIYCGGWMTYQGYRGVGNWHGSPVAEILPVRLRPIFDDRRERPEGAAMDVVRPDHPVTDGIDWTDAPPVYGYNVTEGVEADGTILAEVEGNPLLAVGEVGDGRVIAYTSDPGPKWGSGFFEWDAYPTVWRQALEWVTDGD